MITLDYGVGDEVTIIIPNLIGRVMEICISGTRQYPDVLYTVRYWNHGEMHSADFCPDELSSIKKQIEVGFRNNHD